MAGTDKTKLMDEIESKIQELNLLLSTIKADRSRKPEIIEQYKFQYKTLLAGKQKK
jgi:hypothetical protein